MNLASDMEALAKELPERVGLIFEDGQKFTFGEINALSSKSANLFNQLGIRKGDRIGVYMQNSPTFLMVMFGMWKIGAVIVPVNIMYKEEELRHAFESTNVSTVVTHTDNIERILKIRDLIDTIVLSGSVEKPSQPGIIDYDRVVLKQGAKCQSFTPEDEDVAAILFTGGTTGEPKGAITNHNGWYKALCDLAEGHTGSSERQLAVDESIPPNIVALPLFHSGGQQSVLFAFHVGRLIVLMERFRTERYVNLVEKYKIRSLVLMPTMIHDLVNYDGEIDFSHVKTVLSIGQELRSLLRTQFEEKYKVPIMQNYGSTEVGHVAGWSGKDIKEGSWKPGAVGKIYPSVEVEFRDENGRRLPAGEAGELWVRSKVTLEGYAGKEGKSKDLVKDGWITTGDVGFLDKDGVFFLIGRKREMIKCGGFQVWPIEIEHVLIKHPKLRDVAVLGVPDERMGEVPKAFIVLKETSEHESKEDIKSEIIEYCRDKMAHFKAVRDVEVLPDLPRADTGKILKEKLRQM